MTASLLECDRLWSQSKKETLNDLNVLIFAFARERTRKYACGAACRLMSDSKAKIWSLFWISSSFKAWMSFLFSIFTRMTARFLCQVRMLCLGRKGWERQEGRKERKGLLSLYNFILQNYLYNRIIMMIIIQNINNNSLLISNCKKNWHSVKRISCLRDSRHSYEVSVGIWENLCRKSSIYDHNWSLLFDRKWIWS